MESTINISTKWGAGKRKKSSFNSTGQQLAFLSCIHLYEPLAIGAPVLTHQILFPPLALFNRVITA
jgi:hypothetical protein